jgi:hypothetical protein
MRKLLKKMYFVPDKLVTEDHSRAANEKWAHHPNLRKRPPTPAKGLGSVQRAIKRAFAATMLPRRRFQASAAT